MMAVSATPTMPILLVNASIVSNTLRPVAVGMMTIETTAMRPPTITVEVRSLMPVLSAIAAIGTWMIETSEVSPAKISVRKNRTPKIAPPGIWLMIVGNAMKARPTPLLTTSSTPVPAVWAMNPSAANTPTPASISKPEFAKPTTRPEPVRFVFRFRYEA